MQRIWALTQMLSARWDLSRSGELEFFKLFGSGTGQGFTPVPNTAVYAILAAWPDGATALRNHRNGPVFRRYRAHATESWTLLLRPASVRGSWDGRCPFSAAEDGPIEGSIAVLTRASVRPSIVHRFWRRVPEISRAIGENPDVMFKIGVGEIPWLHQVTFSIWPDCGSMTRFARHGGPHARAIKAVRAGGWFSEELYARFRIVGEMGRWHGVPPLTVVGHPDLAA